MAVETFAQALEVSQPQKSQTWKIEEPSKTLETEPSTNWGSDCKSYSDNKSWEWTSNSEWNGSRDWNKTEKADQQREWDSKSKWDSDRWGASRDRWGAAPSDQFAIQKNFYREADSVANRSDAEVAEILKAHEIAIVKGKNVPKPITTFEEVGFPSAILNSLRGAGFEKPTSIQVQGWPVALSGRDMIGIADTGSGKTCGFLMPAFVHINAQAPVRRGDGPIALVLAPTRELAMQIKGECDKFARQARIRSVCVYGGAPKGDQARALRYGAEIVVATPGRLIDFMEYGTVKLDRVSYLVLDEADRMLDMGFEPQIQQIVKNIREDRQTLLWSATWPKEVRQLARQLCSQDPVHINIGSHDMRANANITQHVELVSDYQKMDKCVELLEYIHDGSKIIVFTATKKRADDLAWTLRSRKWNCEAIHGDKTQDQRDAIMYRFKSRQGAILIATDVAARGLDVKDIRHVINYDFPGNIEDYVHRIGRTGRAGMTGASYTFFTDENKGSAVDLVNLMKEANQWVPEQLEDMASRMAFKANRGWGQNRGYGGKGSGKSHGKGGKSSGRGGFGGFGNRDGKGHGKGGKGDSRGARF